MIGEDDKDLLEESSPRLPAVASRNDPDMMEDERSENQKPSQADPDLLEEEEVNRRKKRQKASMKATGRVAQTSLPVDEEHDDDVVARKAEIQERIDELESTLRYMGTGHPKRAAFEIQLRTMEDMMRRIEEALELTR